MLGHRRAGTLLAATAIGALLPLVSPTVAAADEEAVMLYVRSDDGGASFEAPVPLSAGGGEVGNPHVAATGGAVHTVWSVEVESDGDDESDVFYRRSDDAGASFGEPENLSDNPGGSSESDLAVDGETLQVVWEDGLAPGAEADEVVTRRSTDGGGSFSPAANLSRTTDQHDTDPDVAVEGPLVAVSYEIEIDDVNKDIVVVRSGDGGQTWSEPANLSQDAEHSAESAVEIADGIVHVAYENRGSEATEADDRLAYLRSTDGGATFGDDVILPEGAERRPAVAAVGEVVHVFGCSRSDPADSQLYVYRSEDGGATFAPPVALTDTTAECHKPTVDAHGDLVVVAWEEAAPGEEADILVMGSGDGGRTFGSPVNVSAGPGESEESSIALDPVTGEVHVVWLEEPPEPDDGTDTAAAPRTDATLPVANQKLAGRSNSRLA